MLLTVTWVAEVFLLTWTLFWLNIPNLSLSGRNEFFSSPLPLALQHQESLRNHFEGFLLSSTCCRCREGIHPRDGMALRRWKPAMKLCCHPGSLLPASDIQNLETEPECPRLCDKQAHHMGQCLNQRGYSLNKQRAGGEAAPVEGNSLAGHWYSCSQGWLPGLPHQSCSPCIIWRVTRVGLLWNKVGSFSSAPSYMCRIHGCLL